MANETIIKALQRTKDDNGELHPIFPYTSADAVLWDVNKNQTLEDKIVGGVIDGSSTAVYNDIYTATGTGESSGILKLDLPMGYDDVDVTAEIELNSIISRNHTDLTTYNVDGLYTDNVVKRSTVVESSPDGMYVFIASEYANITTINPAPRLYKVGTGVAHNVAITLRSIRKVIRARFSKDSKTLIVLGITTSNTNPIFEFYSLTSTTTGASATFLFSHTASNENVTNIFFDTMTYSGVQYLIRTRMLGTTGTSLESYTFNGSLSKSTVVTCSNTYEISNDFRISPDSKYIAILSSDGGKIATMGLNNNIYSSRTNSPFTSTGVYGGTGSAVGVGTWTKFKFGPDGKRLYGIYMFGLSITVRVCNIANQYGDKVNTSDETVYYIDTDTDVFPVGVNNVCPLPFSSTFGNTAYSAGADFICVGSGGSSPSIRATSLPKVVRILGTSLSTQTSSKTYSNGVVDTTPRLSTSIFTKYEPELSLFNLREIVDVCVSSYNGFGIGIRSTFTQSPVIPMDFRSFKPTLNFTSNPVSMPIDWDTEIYRISTDGNSFVHSNNSGNGLYAAIKSGSSYYHKIINASKMYTFTDTDGTVRTTTDYIYDVTTIANGELIIAYYKNSQPQAFRYNGSSYQPFTTTSSVNIPLPNSGNAKLLQSSVDVSNGVYTWTTAIILTERIVILKYTYNSQKPELSMSIHASAYAPGVLNITDAAISGNGNRICVLVAGSNGAMLYGFSYSQSNISTIFTNSGNFSTANTNARIELNYDGSLLTYTLTGSSLSSARLAWVSSNSFTNITTPSIYVNGRIVAIKYAAKAKRFFVFTSNSGVYIFDDNATSLSLFDRANIPALRADGAVSEDGALLMGIREGGLYDHTALYRINSTKISGTITVSGKLTEDGWKNVYIQSSNTDLNNITTLGYDNNTNRGVVLIGNSSTVWSPLYAHIKKIIISGPGAGRDAYKTNYASSIITNTSSIIHNTRTSESETDETIVKRVQMKSHKIDYTKWIDTRSTIGLWTYRIYNDYINPNSTVNIDINDISSMIVANTAGLTNVATEYIGYVEIYSAQKPVANITANINIFN